jgi:hypothetical protein
MIRRFVRENRRCRPKCGKPWPVLPWPVLTNDRLLLAVGGGQAGEHLWVVLRAGQDVMVGDVEEWDGSGLVGAVDVGGTS